MQATSTLVKSDESTCNQSDLRNLQKSNYFIEVNF